MIERGVLPDHVLLLRPVGELDEHDQVTLDQALRSCVESQRLRVLVDLAQVSRISDTARDLLVRADEALARAGGHLVVVGAQPAVVATLAGIGELTLDLCDGLGASLQRVRTAR